jgi:1-deoxy-D-xylulose-5-phosphate synthase
MPALAHIGEGMSRVDVIRHAEEARVLVVAYGQFAGMGLAVAERLDDQGVTAMVVDPLWALPISPNLVELAQGFDLVVTIEDNLVEGGLGQRLRSRLFGTDTTVLNFGIPQEFLAQGSRDEVLEDVGLTAPKIALAVLDSVLATTEPAGAHLN